MNGQKTRNSNGTLRTYQQISEDSNIGLNTVMRIAKESGALVKIGRISRVDPEIFYHYIREVYQAK